MIKNLPHYKKFLWLLIFLIPLSFRKGFDNIWNDYLVIPILTKFDDSLLNDLLVLAVSISIILYGIYKFKTKYLISFFHFVVVLCITLVYSLYRFPILSHSFIFKKITFCSSIAYSDCIIFASFLSMLLLVVIWSIINNKTKNFPNEGFLIDNPLKWVDETKKIEGEENTKNTLLIENLAEKLLKTHSKDTSFALGIIGDWGSGKTSFLALLKNKIKQKDNRESTIFIDFNPWNSHSPQAIIQDFFDSFQEELSEYSAEIDDYLGNYAKKLSEIEEEGLIPKVISIISDRFSDKETLSQQHERINEVLQKIGKQIFVFIDDLDRLDKKEIIEVIRLIRNSANFHNTFFIVAYEKGYVENALKDLSEYNKEFFLEKIFQLELHLPTYEYHRITDLLYKELIEKMPFIEEQDKVQKFLKKHKQLPYLIQNFRDVKRFINSFYLIYDDKLQAETYFADMFNIELLRFKFPLIYELLKKKTKLFLTTQQDNYSGTSVYKLTEPNNNLSLIESYIQKEKLYSQNIDLIMHLLCELFSSSNFSSHEDLVKSVDVYRRRETIMNRLDSVTFKKNVTEKIENPKCISTYFAYRNFDDTIGNQEFIESFSSEENFKKKIAEWKSNNLMWEFIRKCKEKDTFENDEERKRVIKGIFHFAHIEGESFKYDEYNLLQKFNFKDNIIGKSFTQALFEEAHCPYWFESDFLSNINMYDHNFFLDKDERNTLLIFYLRKIAEETSHFVQDEKPYKYLLSWTFNKTMIYERKDNSIMKHYPQEAKDIVIQFIKEKDLIGALQSFIEHNWRTADKEKQKSYLVTDYLLHFFSTWENFETFLSPLRKDNPAVEEFWDFYEQSKAVDFKQYIPYNFQHLEIIIND